MELTLRQARKVETKIAAFANKPIPTTSDISCYIDDPIEAWDAAISVTLAAVVEVENAIKARYELREAIANANHTHGVNQIINQRKAALDLLKLYQLCVSARDRRNDVESDSGIAVQKLIKMKESGGFPAEYSSRRVDTLSVLTVPSEFVGLVREGSLRQTAQKVERYDEELMRLNTTCKIHLEPNSIIATFINSNDLI